VEKRNAGWKNNSEYGLKMVFRNDKCERRAGIELPVAGRNRYEQPADSFPQG
jgi:hypothetical protein